jgi:small-conductance mechanosensitive channel
MRTPSLGSVRVGTRECPWGRVAGSRRLVANSAGMDTSDRVVQALVLAGVWLGVVIGVRIALRVAFDRYESRLAERDPVVAARRRTTFSFLLRVVIALVVLIGVWSVLSVFTVTQEVASAFLASGAVLALVAGVALSTPLGNLGSGVLLSFAQPARLGDRITIGEHTGVVRAISLSYTTLVTDEGPYVYVPNQKMVSEMLVNRSIGGDGEPSPAATRSP